MSNVSVIVPCYNSADFLCGTIDSVLRQEMTDWELVLVDDGSRDATWEIISRYMRKDSRIAGFRKSNEGTTKTRNCGFAKADSSSRYLFFLDHDDQLEPSALAKMSAHLDTHPDAGLLTCQFQEIGGDGSRLGNGQKSRWVPGIFFPRELRDDETETPFVTFFCATGQGPFALYRRSIYVQTEGWETAFWPHEDTDMFCQIALLSKAHFLPERLYLKRRHPAQGINHGPRVQQSYAAFRTKWDNRQPKDQREADLLRDAKHYYYSVHKPFRDLKVARVALSEFVADPRAGRLSWCLHLFFSALRGFLFGRFEPSKTSFF